MTKWTDEQLSAITKENTNIIVSAGAGSGKTAVLTERVLRKLRNGISINNLLILTFTNKAAFEMKERIRKGISKDKSIIKELDFIDSSYITTFDSFALSLVKKYSYLLNISENVTVANSSIIYLEKKKILDDIFDKLYESNNPYFLKLLDDLTIKKDDEIKEYIKDINDKLDLKYDKLEYLDNYLDDYYSNSHIDLLINEYIDLLKNKIKEIDLSLTKLSYYVDSDYFYEVRKMLIPLLNSNTYNEIKNNNNIKLPNLKRGSEDFAKDYKEEITDLISQIGDLVRFNDEDELKETLLLGKDYIKIIIDIIKELDERIMNYKKSLNVYEFSDISKMAIRVLKENERVRLELKESLNEIMVDEYQDTSDLQEEFINLIENNNVYMVGDIKQSIYRFRNANPYLFKTKYENYSNNNGGFKIDLTKNFRSRSEVINNINLIFSYIMTKDLGGAEYKETHKMLFGNTSYDEEGKSNQNNNLEIFNYEYPKDYPYTEEEIEIFFIANDIKKKVKEKYQVFDRDTNSLRDVQYKDFAILLDKSASFDLYKKIFEYLNVSLTKYNTTNLTEEKEIVLIKNIISLLLNRKDKNYGTEFVYSFVSIARSYLFEYTDQEIFNHIKSKDYNSSLLTIIDDINKNIMGLSLKELIIEIIDKFDFYNKIILVGDTRNRINRLSSIINLFESLSEINYTIVDSYNYLEELIKDKYKLEVKDLDIAPDSVKLMTIHASKGLEFPICYFAGLKSKFNIRELNEKFIYNSKYGIVSPYYKEGIGKNFVKELVKDDYIKEEISEKIRLLYVALTRAKEKLIVVTSLKDKNISDILHSRSFGDMYNYSKEILKDYITNFDINSLNINRDYNLIKKTNYKDKIKKADKKIEIKELNLINNDLLKQERISKETKEILDKETKEKMKFGTYIHEILENIDFRNPNYDLYSIDGNYKDIIIDFISKMNIDKAINIYKEYEFTYEENNNIYHGIIDLILEYDDHFSIIDYKLKNIDDENYNKQLKRYKDFIEKKTNKKIEIYLFSILSNILTKID